MDFATPIAWRAPIYKYRRRAAAALVTVGFVVAAMLVALPAAGDHSDEAVRFYDPAQREIEGWKVAIDPALLQESRAEFAGKAFEALANHLQRLSLIHI